VPRLPSEECSSRASAAGVPARSAAHGLVQVQPSINLGASCYQLATVVPVAASLNQPRAVHVTIARKLVAERCFTTDIAHGLPVYEAVLELCVRYRDGIPVLRGFFLESVNSAVMCYDASFNPRPVDTMQAYLLGAVLIRTSDGNV